MVDAFNRRSMGQPELAQGKAHCRLGDPFQNENVMKAAVLALVITGAALLLQTVPMAQTAPAERSEVSVIYVPPKNPAHQLGAGQSVHTLPQAGERGWYLLELL